MRFVIREQPYEKPLAGGQLRYERDGRATGAVESWRLSQALEDYQFLRVDLDARQAKSGHTYLYHLVLHENGRPERLQYRFWGSGLEVRGHVLLLDGTVTASRLVNGRRFEEEIAVSGRPAFWFPSSVGLSLLASLAEEETAAAVTLQASACPEPGSESAKEGSPVAPDSVFALQQIEIHLHYGDKERLALMEQEWTVRPLSIYWNGHTRTIWLDANSAVLKMVRDDGLTAVATRYIRYGI
jgi:hypothetical protein